MLSGGVRVVIEFANRLTENGHEVHLIHPSMAYDEIAIREIRQDVVLVPTRSIHNNEISSPFSKLRLAWQLALTVPKSDLIISTHTPTTISAFIASKFLRKGQSAWLYQDYLEMFLGKPAESWLLKNASRWQDVIFTVSQYSKTELEGYYPGKIFVVGEGLSHSDVFKPVPEFHRPENLQKKKIIVTMGDPRSRKGFPDFLNAVDIVFEKVPELHLWIFAKEELEINTRVPFDFFFRPERENLASMYANCDIFVSASWWESFGLPPLEAMACGAPVITTDSRGVRDFTETGINCLVVPPRDSQALAEAILRLLEDNRLSNRFRRTGPLTAAKFSWDIAVNRFEVALATLPHQHDIL